jgi:tetrahedral aminopeptidase
MFSKKSIKNFEKMCLQPGVSGHEINTGISDLILNIVNKISLNSTMDQYGNVISIIGSGRKEIIIDAHLDEFGFYVQKNENKIYLKPIGSLNYKTIKDQRAKVVNKNISGRLRLIDGKNIEFVPAKNHDIIRISRDDLIIYKKTFQYKNRGVISATSLDNRVGCFLAIEIMKSLKNKLPSHLSVKFIFSAGEESGKFFLNKVIKNNNNLLVVIDAAYAEPIQFIDRGYDIVIPKVGNGCAIQTRGKNFIIKKNILEKIEQLAVSNNISFQKETPPKQQGQTNLSGLKLKNKNNCVVINIPVTNQHEIVSECSLSDIYSAFKMILLIIKTA